MRFALYHPWVYLRSGLERSFIEVMRRSSHEWTWYTNYYRPDETFPEIADLAVVQLRPEIQPVRSPLRAAATAASLLATKIPDHHDATLISLNGVSDLALARAPRPVVGLCFTPLKAIYDPQARQSMKERKPLKHAITSALAPGFVAADRRLWRRIDRLISISEETTSRIVGGRLWPAGDIALAYPGVDLQRFSPGPADRAPGLLAAGRISWYKNLELAIDTVRELQHRDRPADLVIAGFLHPSDAAYLASLQERAAGLSVRFVINPSDSELTELYRVSDLMLFTAINEDFGIAPVEAMACGTPVIATDAGGPRETVVDGVSGWLTDGSPQAFAAAIEQWHDRPDKAQFRQQARTRAEEFDWQHFVDRIDRTMEAAVRPR